MNPPPRPLISAPIVHILAEVYKQAYRIGKKVPKRDRFSLWSEVESAILKCWVLSIEAAIEERQEKTGLIKELRVAIDIAKHLTRTAEELKIIEQKNYFAVQEKLVEASKMAHGWLIYIQRNESRS